ncbi:alpha-ketoglutarate-dependent dioxygenase alkB homolog 3 [Octopus sinensis]|uniref:Alpha-ketoglutarate-dependent dioxygenase alkB homolog 3 n=1 Tax=Octopus sinensis TaxID=2607531 RepID=A0A6P7U146_9MOLL|nr:alpha-ketoglutarate-dependent dioxygenase alkB homolog 3 [Octopus sinensis]XP_029658424.1 alpha-ketoglutarate-dependent dioxygenase alkB homolog 3 [Octopus sinensis]
MSSDKRRRARIQGGWSSASNNNTGKKLPQPKRPPVSFNTLNDQDNKEDSSKQEEYAQFLFTGSSNKFREKPPVKTITEHGIHDISASENGVSRIRFFPSFIEEKEADRIFRTLLHDLPWKQASDVLPNGSKFLQPRLTAWYGDLPYSYSGQTHQPNAKWHPTLQTIREHLQQSLGILFNSMLANLYRDGHDSVGWHTDKNPAIGDQPTIASLSFGEGRMFELRRNPPPEENGDYTYMEHVNVPVTNGCLLTMEGALQHDWQHRVPKEYHERGARINLTFRLTIPG